MSIYATIGGIDDDAPCGQPWTYRGSHILPAETDPRGGDVSLALIPSHITRDGRDDQPEDGRPWPWLRLSVDSGIDHGPGQYADVILNPAQARHLAARLTAWADRTQETDTPTAPGRAEQLDLMRRALDRADALTDQWAGDMTTITRSAAADLYASVLELHGWEQTDPPNLHVVPTDHTDTEDMTR